MLDQSAKIISERLKKKNWNPVFENCYIKQAWHYKTQKNENLWGPISMDEKIQEYKSSNIKLKML